MQNMEDLNPAEKTLESALGQLKPAANRLSRDELMFKAGRSMAGGNDPWKILSGVLSVLLISSIFIRPESNDYKSPELTASVEPIRFEVVQAMDQTAQVETGGTLDYVTLRKKIVEQGLDSLPPRRVSGIRDSVRNRKQLLESMLSS